MATTTQIKVSNVFRREHAQPLVDLLEAETYMGLKVKVCPVGGSFDVLVATNQSYITEEKLTAMVLDLLAQKVCDR